MQEDQLNQNGCMDQPHDSENGGRTSISPPANQQIQGFEHPGQVLASGVDTISLALDLNWKNDNFFKTLERLKREAEFKRAPMPSVLQTADQNHSLTYEVEPYGSEGYSWVLRCPEWSMKLGAWLKPMSRPSAMITIRAECLWLHGVIESLDRLTLLLNSVDAQIDKPRASRVDVCVDIQLPAEMWHLGLVNHAVTYAAKTGIYLDRKQLTGMQIGKGDVLCRLYDKPLEIASSSHKLWMYDVWKIESVPENQKVIRVEFQLRREVLKELAIDTIWHFVHHPRALWAYCTQHWLQFAQNPNANRRDRVLLPFWKTLQDGFLGGQVGHPLIRAKIVNTKKKQLAQQLMGQFSSLIAMDCDSESPSIKLEDELPIIVESAERIHMDDTVLSERVRRKLAKNLRLKEKFSSAQGERKVLGLPQWRKEDDKCA